MATCFLETKFIDIQRLLRTVHGRNVPWMVDCFDNFELLITAVNQIKLWTKISGRIYSSTLWLFSVNLPSESFLNGSRSEELSSSAFSHVTKVAPPCLFSTIYVSGPSLSNFVWLKPYFMNDCICSSLLGHGGELLEILTTSWQKRVFVCLTKRY